MLTLHKKHIYIFSYLRVAKVCWEKFVKFDWLLIPAKYLIWVIKKKMKHPFLIRLRFKFWLSRFCSQTLLYDNWAMRKNEMCYFAERSTFKVYIFGWLMVCNLSLRNWKLFNFLQDRKSMQCVSVGKKVMTEIIN